MRIDKLGWICCTDKTLRHPHLPEMGFLRCGRCGDFLQSWYQDLIDKLRPLLSKNHQPLCCYCAFKGAMKLEKCPECGKNTTADWTAGDFPLPRIKCKICGWEISYSNGKKVEEKISNYLATLW